ncbi:pyruvate dehydrogenase (acetyl-transferring) E1 component subunit alpha [Nitritalea halalkaliphila LW7]|uniref:Pyruvate dehydrogenase (Acetyl-transferring) E1 component subunit alpha n=1 Tax=Nitritalea halalkaliphila LW7 TaxID=1189621 RepID=I5BWY2_9BACT|nr:pyruvate dehydrogenase (acetyl-transferring) E1 component subunit alpha [Nitritalea halalkaliphila LW7]
MTEEEIKEIDKRVKKQVEDAVKFAEESPWPDGRTPLKMCTSRKTILS